MTGSEPTNHLSSADLDAGDAGIDPLAGRTLDGRYRVDARLGAGGVGVVYAALHVGIKKKVAIKILHAALGWREQFRLRFEREARAASKLSHPACVSVIDFGRVERIEPPDVPGGESVLGTPYLVMEYVRGEVLADRLAAGAVAPPEAVRIARGLLAALRHAHGLGIVHRDVKPANIMLSPPGELEPWVKLLDFGLAKDLGDDAGEGGDPPLTEAGMVFGTPGYLSPEQAGGQRADARSDLYSLAVVLFEMLCGRPPFIGADRMQVVRDHLKTPPPRARALAPAVSTALDEVVARALAKDPGARFADAEAFATALAACPEASAVASAAPSAVEVAALPAIPLDRAPTAAAPASAAPVRAMIRAAQRRPQLVAAAAFALLGVVIALFVLRLRGPGPAAGPTAAVVSPQVAATASARRHIKLADDYQKKLWCKDAIEELEAALGDDPILRADPEVTRVAIACLRQKTQGRAIRFLVDQVGPAAIPQLKHVATNDVRPEWRQAAARALAEMK